MDIETISPTFFNEIFFKLKKHNGKFLVINNSISLSIFNSTISKVNSKNIKNLITNYYLSRFLNQNNQSKFISKLPNLQIKDVLTSTILSPQVFNWYLLAITNLLPLKGSVTNFHINKFNNNLCRKCNSHPETFEHISNYCLHTLSWQKTERHDLILKYIIKNSNIDNSKFILDKKFSETNLRPDLLILKKSKDQSDLCVDVSIPINTEQHIQNSFNKKISKYNHLSTIHQKNLNKHLDIIPIIIGNLGSPHPDLATNLSKLNIIPTKKILTTLTAISIKGSFTIFNNFMKQHPHSDDN